LAGSSVEKQPQIAVQNMGIGRVEMTGDGSAADKAHEHSR
jgi:hypothetical protein